MSNATHEHEYESLGEFEYEGEHEGEFEYELAHELAGEGEGEGEFEAHEHEHEGEHEAEQFFGSLAKLAGRALRSPALRKIALQAAKAALREQEGEYEGEG